MFIENSYLFQSMSKETQNKVREVAVGESHPKGAFIFRVGEPANHLYILQEGRVRLSVGDKGHIAHVVSDPGDAIGWSSMVENEGYTATKHQREVGAGYFDAVTQAVTGGTSAITALAGSTEVQQFQQHA